MIVEDLRRCQDEFYVKKEAEPAHRLDVKIIELFRETDCGRSSEMLKEVNHKTILSVKMIFNIL